MSPFYGDPITHQIEKGDVLYGIALKYNCSYPSISRANRVRNPNEVRAGTGLVIPSFMILPRHNREETVILNIPEFRLYHFLSEKEVKVYPVCLGLPTWQTPKGQFQIINKVTNPAWYMTNEMSEKMAIKKEIIPPGPLNPLGDRWVGTSLKHIGIHSTNQPMSIGRPLSHGCVRLYPDSARVFYEAVSLKEKGRIIYELVKMVVWQDNIYLEVHEDVYQGIGDHRKEFEKVCKLLEIDVDHLDKAALATCLTEKRGIPVVVGRISRN